MPNIIDVVLGKNKSLKHMTRDSDGDKVPNILDCEPFNPNKQGVAHNIAAAIARKAGKEELADKIKERGDQRDADRAEIRQVNRESFQKERLVVARERGKARARPAASFGSFVKEIRTTSPLRPRGTTTKKGKKSTKFVPIKGKPGQFKKVTTRAKGMSTSTRPKTIRDVLGGNIPKFF